MQNSILKSTLIFTVVLCSILSFAKDESISNYDDLYKRIKKLHAFKKVFNTSKSDNSWLKDPQKRKQLILSQKREELIIFYLQNKPEDLQKLEKQFSNKTAKWFFSNYAWSFPLTKDGDIFSCKWIRNAYNKKYKTNFNKKYRLIRFAVTYGLGMEGTQDLINYAEQTYPELDLKELFQTYPPFLRKYEQFKDAVSKNINLFEEVAKVLDKVPDETLEYDWNFIMFNYSNVKLEEENTTFKKDNKKPVEGFFNDFFTTYKHREEGGPLLPKPEKLRKLFKKIAARGGKYDFNSEKIIKNITGYNNAYGNCYKEWGDRYGRISVQTMISDDKGKIRYIFSFSDALIANRNRRYSSVLDHYLPMVFYFAKVIYKDGKPANLISTEIYADQELKELLNSTVREYEGINLKQFGKKADGGSLGSSIYNLKGFPFPPEIYNFFEFGYIYPRIPNNKYSKIFGGKEMENSWKRQTLSVGTDLIPELGEGE